MNDVEKLAKEFISKGVSKKLESDIEYGKQLKDICDRVNLEGKDCPILHKSNVINYVNRIDKEYRPLVNLYLISNGYVLGNNTNSINSNNVTDCHLINTCLFILERTKEIKDSVDKLEKIDEAFKLVKEE